MTSPRLIFESTAHFLQSEIQSVFRFFRKSAVTPNLCAIISPRGEECGLVAFQLVGRGKFPGTGYVQDGAILQEFGRKWRKRRRQIDYTDGRFINDRVPGRA